MSHPIDRLIDELLGLGPDGRDISPVPPRAAWTRSGDYILRLMRQRGAPITRRELVEGLSMNAEAVKSALARLCRAGKVRQVGRGLYTLT
jgi:hypothetical protein